jgi:hypothetical protein
MTTAIPGNGRAAAEIQPLLPFNASDLYSS